MTVIFRIHLMQGYNDSHKSEMSSCLKVTRHHIFYYVMMKIFIDLCTGYHEGAPPGYQPLPANVPPTAYVYIRGNCPACHTGTLEDSCTALGVCLAICFFPIGIVCCLMLTEKRCNHCGMSFT